MLHPAENQLSDAPAISPDFARLFIANVNAPQDYPVHKLFNAWWAHAPEKTIAAYVDRLSASPEGRAFLADAHIAEPVDLKALELYPDGTFGRGYYEFVVGNQLMEKLAIDYRAFHAGLKAAGALDRMPEPMQFAIIRGFQVHDMLHVLTGYPATPAGELALQAFCLAQLNFPYFAMWMANVATRMTFVEPRIISDSMDAISDGWRFGRETRNIQFPRWEERFGERLVDLRAEFGIAQAGLRPAH
jgi:ubiquinone biosynthesis protein COQ4